MATEQVDILIIGGGLSGAALLLALAHTQYRVLLVEAMPYSAKVQPDFDARSIALSPASVRILQMLNVWPLLQPHACPIRSVHVSDRGRFGSARLNGKELAPLGYVVELPEISRVLYQMLGTRHLLAPAQLTEYDTAQHVAVIKTDMGKEHRVQAKLVVAADGAHSAVRRFCRLPVVNKEYEQTAIVANIALGRSHGHVAYERFTAHGPLALLPMTGQRAALVWALLPSEAANLMQVTDLQFLHALQRAFGYRLGRFIRVGQRTSYPLRQSCMTKTTSGPVVFVGNAAHTLHPVAGQGFNLGLRDVATLAQCVVRDGLTPDMLATYQQLRQSDQMIMQRFTDMLAEVFTSRIPGVGLARNVGLVAVDNLTFLKNSLARYARGFGGIVPDLVCGIPLQNT